MKNETNCCQREFPDRIRITNQLYLYISISLVLGGLLGNLINILVFSSKPLRKHSSNAFVLVLATSDSIYLVNAFSNWLTSLKCLQYQQSSMDILNDNNALSKFIHFFLDLPANYSSMGILFFTTERLIVVYKPLKVKQMCPWKRTKITCLSLLTVITVWISPYHFIMIGVDGTSGECFSYCGWDEHFSFAYIIEKVTFRIGPVLAIAIVNGCIIYKISASDPIGKDINQRKKDKNRQVTRLLILISVSYVILVLPLLIFYGLVFLNNSNVIAVSMINMEIARKWMEIYVEHYGICYKLLPVQHREQYVQGAAKEDFFLEALNFYNLLAVVDKIKRCR